MHALKKNFIFIYSVQAGAWGAAKKEKERRAAAPPIAIFAPG